MKVSVVGVGYVGLTTSLFLASRGFDIIAIDVDSSKIAKLSDGISPIHEPGVDKLLKRCVKMEKIRFTSEYSLLPQTEITMVCVGTPPREDGMLEMRYMEQSMRDIGGAIKGKKARHTVVVRSTVMPGSTQGRLREILERSSGKEVPNEVGLVFNPEFLREGMALKDTERPGCIVIGAMDENSFGCCLRFYRKIYGSDFNSIRVIRTTPVNAEIIKMAVNALRAVQLSALNTVADLCQKLEGGDVSEVVNGISSITNLDSRYLNAGMGFGGSCLPKDTRALASLCSSLGIPNELFSSSLAVNRIRVSILARHVIKSAGKNGTVSILGLSFKPDTDDIRESPSLELIQELLSSGISVKVYDPQAMENARKVLGSKVLYAPDAESCIAGSDLCVVATAWEEFKSMLPEAFETMRKKVVFDCRRVYDEKAFKRRGIKIVKIGTFTQDCVSM